MSLSLALLFLLNSVFINAKSLPSSNQLVNPCTPEGLYAMQYYYPHPRGALRYIECDPWGGMHVKLCPKGSKWSSRISSCVIQRLDNEAKKQIIHNETQSCAFHGNRACHNGGFCSQSTCFCLSNYSGDFCEHVSPSIGVFGQLISDSFSLEAYKLQRPLSNDTYSLNATIDASIIVDELTRKSVQEYLDRYPHGEMRFDTLINYLVQDFLSHLYPSAFYLKEFTLESEIEMGYTNAIPNLLQTAKYSFDNFDNFFNIFIDVLDQLVKYLSKHITNANEEAQSFFEVYDRIYSQFRSSNGFLKVKNFTNETMNTKEPTREEMKKSMHDDFNATLRFSYNLFRYLRRFDDDLSVKGVNYTNEQTQEASLNFTMDSITNELLTAINLRSKSIWDSMTYYGFWHVISSYVAPIREPTTTNAPKQEVQKLEELLVSNIPDDSTKATHIQAKVIEISNFKIVPPTQSTEGSTEKILIDDIVTVSSLETTENEI